MAAGRPSASRPLSANRFTDVGRPPREHRDNAEDEEVVEHDRLIAWVKEELDAIGI